MKPIVVAQTMLPCSDTEKKQWIKAQMAAGEAKGVTWHRIAHHPSNRHGVLYEGWKKKPADKGAARWKED